jgi:hypothetical protein
MNVYEKIAHETFTFLCAANELLEAHHSWNDIRLRQAVDHFYFARFPASDGQPQGDAIDDAWRRLVALAGSSEASPIRSNYQFCHRLHDFLFFDYPREHGVQSERPVSEYESSIIVDPSRRTYDWRNRLKPTPAWRQDHPELIVDLGVDRRKVDESASEPPEPCYIQPAIDALRSDEGQKWVRREPVDLGAELGKMLDEAAKAHVGGNPSGSIATPQHVSANNYRVLCTSKVPSDVRELADLFAKNASITQRPAAKQIATKLGLKSSKSLLSRFNRARRDGDIKFEPPDRFDRK